MCCRSFVEREKWVTALEKAISEHNNRELSFLNMKFVMKNAGSEQLKLGYEVNISPSLKVCNGNILFYLFRPLYGFKMVV